MTKRRTTLATIALIALIGGATSLNASDVGARPTTSIAPINSFDRAAVAASYKQSISDQESVRASWSGAPAGCRTGSTSASFDAATLDSINWFRRMTGLPTVGENGAASNAASKAALMMDAQNGVSHYPGPNWACYSAAGAASAGRSNLTLGISGSRGVIGQIEDAGASNTPLGHRRWLLYPPLASVGIGNTATASAIDVIGDLGPRPTSTTWIAWPPAGYVPAETVYKRWSISYNGGRQADFSEAKVTMTQDGRPVQVRVLPIAAGYGDSTLAWEPVGIDPIQGRDVHYKVTVSNIEISQSAMSTTYELVSFDPGSAATVRVAATISAPGERFCRGQRATIVGTPGSDTIRGTSGRDVIVALGGADTIYGGGGNDIICAGAGNDTVFGDGGDDVILGGLGHDTLRGGPGRDVIHGQNGRDRLFGNGGADRLVGGNRADVLVGNSGKDSCWGQRKGSTSDARDTRRSCESGRN